MGWVTDWSAQAACRTTDPDELFVQGAAQNRAKAVCTGCPVRTECLADALDNRVEFGVWGGMTERERRALLRRRPTVTSWRRLLETARMEYERSAGMLPVAWRMTRCTRRTRRWGSPGAAGPVLVGRRALRVIPSGSRPGRGAGRCPGRAVVDALCPLRCRTARCRTGEVLYGPGVVPAGAVRVPDATRVAGTAALVRPGGYGLRAAGRVRLTRDGSSRPPPRPRRSGQRSGPEQLVPDRPRGARRRPSARRGRAHRRAARPPRPRPPRGAAR